VEVDGAGLSEDVEEAGCGGLRVRESAVAVMVGGELGQEPVWGCQESGNRTDAWRKSSQRSVGMVGSGSVERRRLRASWKGGAAAPGWWVSVRRGMAWWQRGVGEEAVEEGKRRRGGMRFAAQWIGGPVNR
jgi:hypothetical protein